MTYSYKLFDSKGFPYRVCKNDFYNYVNQFSYSVFQLDDDFHFFRYFENQLDSDVVSYESLGYFTVCS